MESQSCTTVVHKPRLVAMHHYLASNVLDVEKKCEKYEITCLTNYSSISHYITYLLF